MPFDPKLVHADEAPVAENGDLNLPPDLAALAEQLHDDATHLAASYPPTIALQSPALRPNQTRRRTTALIASASAATLAAFLTGFVVWQGRESTLLEHSAAPSIPADFITTATPSDTTISLTELSSPELEALLDLMERSPGNALRVSF